MKVAFNAGAYFKYQNDRNIYFHPEAFLQSVGSFPEHQFLFIFQDPITPELIFPANVTPIVIRPHESSLLKWRIRYAIKIPRALKKFKAEVFISHSLISGRTPITQLLLWPETGFIGQPALFEKRELSFLNRYTPRMLNCSAGIIMASHASKKVLRTRYKIPEEKLSVLYPGQQPSFKEMNNKKREAVLQKHTRGNEFFIYTGVIGAHQNLTTLLKAFSFFKKRQRSSMHLVIAGKQGPGFGKFTQSLNLYRFTKEVHILTDLPREEMEEITASAYAMCYFPVNKPSPSMVISAMQCKVPVITSDIPALREYCGDAGIYADPLNFKAISEQIMLLYKDEQLRNQLIQKGLLQASWYGEKAFPFFPELLRLATKDPPRYGEDGKSGSSSFKI